MRAAFSTIASVSVSLSFSLSSSINAALRLLPLDSVWLLASQIFRRLMSCRITDERDFPAESFPVFPIVVANPRSWMASELGAPVLLLLAESSRKDRRSGLESSTISSITFPHFWQNCSPVELSVRTNPPHLVQLSRVFKICIIKFGLLLIPFFFLAAHQGQSRTNSIDSSNFCFDDIFY